MAKNKPSPEYVHTVLQRLQEAHPDAHCELNYETPLQLLIATILSAQTTDVRVNQVTPDLFAKYPDAAAFAAADRAELEEAIRLAKLDSVLEASPGLSEMGRALWGPASERLFGPRASGEPDCLGEGGDLANA